MLTGAALHTLNAIYYCDKVVQNYGSCKLQEKQELEAKSGTKNKAQ